MEMDSGKPYRLFRHYKGNFYLFKGTLIYKGNTEPDPGPVGSTGTGQTGPSGSTGRCVDSDEGEKMVYYQALYGKHKHFCRPPSVFHQMIDPVGSIYCIPQSMEAESGHSISRYDSIMHLSPLLKKCLVMASQAHTWQTRDDNVTPYPSGDGRHVTSWYINHPIKVAIRIFNLYPELVKAIAAAFLHDTLEDTELTYEQIKNSVGAEIADIVLEVTDDQKISKRQQKIAQIENAKGKSIFAKMVKTADKIDNCSDFARDNVENLVPIMCFSKKVVDGMKCPEIVELTSQFDALYYRVVPADMTSKEFDQNVSNYLNSKSDEVPVK